MEHRYDESRCTKAFGITSLHKGKKATWWSNEEMLEAVKEKRCLYKQWQKDNTLNQSEVHVEEVEVKRMAEIVKPIESKSFCT